MAKARREYEAQHVAGAARRMINGLVKRSAGGEIEALEELIALQSHLQAAITEAGRRAHDDFGYSYTLLGAQLGVTRQAARQRFTTKPENV